MALIPLKQRVVRKVAGIPDDFGYAETIEEALKCRFENKVEKITTPNGDEYVSGGRFYFAKSQALSYDDAYTYADEDSPITEYRPKLIETVRGFNGKALIKRVFV